MRTIIFLPVALLSLVIGCQRDDAIVTYKAPKDPPRAKMDAGANDAHDHHNEITWTAPDGWKELPADQFRFAAFQAGDDPGLVVTIIPMSPNQAILPNINRWEGQIGLPPSSEAEANAKVKFVEVAGAQIATLDLIGEKQSIAVAFAEQPEHTWYFKMQGERDKLAAQRANFDKFVQSVRFHADVDHVEPTTAPSTAPTAPAPAASAKPSDGSAKWNVPAGWQQQPDKPMRVATFRTSADAKAGSEIVISRFPSNFGSILDNVNRWRNQVGLPPVTNESAVPPQKLAVGATQCDVYDIAGEQQRIRVVLVPTPDGQTMWFFKMQGPLDAVAKDAATFDQFVQSVRF